MSTLSEVLVSVISSLNFGPTPISPTDIEIGSLEEIGAKDFLSIRTSSLAAKKMLMESLRIRHSDLFLKQYEIIGWT